MWWWRVTAALAAGILCVLVAVAGPGSIETLRYSGPSAASARGHAPPWAQPCFGRSPEAVHADLAFCARVRGRVVYADAMPGSGETHVLVVGSFHMVMVELPRGARRPGWGSKITAVGPLLRARNGQREVQAVWVRNA